MAVEVRHALGVGDLLVRPGADAQAALLRPLARGRRRPRGLGRRGGRLLARLGLGDGDDDGLGVVGTGLGACVESKFCGAFVLNHRFVLHAIDATPARWRGDAGSSPLDRARTAASSPRNDLVKNCRVNPTHWLISTQVRSTAARRGRTAGSGPTATWARPTQRQSTACSASRTPSTARSGRARRSTRRSSARRGLCGNQRHRADVA